ncbi:hypothetical protein TanjilG_15431 [Lupinus angustifolius]|uniref:Uncharacterized protein n=1 Tax=Lupinus angustifolius TaxID=3871 RepID=A0A4P1RLC9_LUPAN|nr:hypothetical protein TanjilG_15431 [Lupinus angustifolius]
MLLAGLVGFSVDAQTGVKGHRTPQSNADPWFFLEDLWESFIESSAFGVEVPLIVNGSDSIQQYYVPYLSAIQLYSEERYAIYRIPVGSTLKSLDTSFLTFHSLSTHSRSTSISSFLTINNTLLLIDYRVCRSSILITSTLLVVARNGDD